MFQEEISKLVFVYCASYCSLVFGSVQNSSHTIQCLIDMLNQCPPNSSCDQGSCVCLRQFIQNPHYSEEKKNDFCIEMSQAQSSNGNKSITYDKVFREAPAVHHILGGIFIPVCAVVMVLATIILVNKMRPIQRIRQLFLSNRPRRPAYEDVVLVGFEQ